MKLLRKTMRRFFQFRLRFQLILVVTLLVVVAVNLFAYFALQRQRTIYATEFKNATLATIEAARLGLEIGLKDENYESINTVLRWVKQNENVDFIVLTDEKGELMASFPETMTLTPQEIIKLPKALSLTEKVYLREGVWKTPFGGEGILYIGFSTAYLQRAERDTLVNLSVIVTLVILLCVFSAYFLAGQITKPLEKLKSTTLKISRNELTERADAETGSQEMRTVALAFNQMIEKLLDSQSQRLAEMESFNSSLEERNTVIEETNKKVMDSIAYAQLIQNALFPVPESIERPFIKFCPLFWPKDIVSGDFYWAREHNGCLYVAVADCTGHGVPGAFMTLIGGAFLEQTISQHDSDDLASVLSTMNDRVRQFLKQDTDHYITQDGMDMGLLRIDPNNKTIRFAGARRPLYVMYPDGSFEEFKSVRRSIGGKNRISQQEPYYSNDIPYKPGCRLILSTDGFADQFDIYGKKFGSRTLKQLILDNRELDLEYLIEKLEALYFQHRGSEEQTDDVTLIGLEITA